MKKHVLHAALLATSAAGTALSIPALGQSGSSGSGEQMVLLEEVIVTARRREEMLSDVPASMTVFNHLH